MIYLTHPTDLLRRLAFFGYFMLKIILLLLLPRLLNAAPMTAPEVSVQVEAGAPPLRRFALIAGANHGGGDRVTLRYAVSDAEAMRRVLRGIGGVQAGDDLLLADPAPAALSAAFDQMKARLERARQAAPKSRLELVVYYSGHADAEGLLLGGDRVTYPDLKAQIRAMPADVHIAIVDACASGALARAKGGVRRPPILLGGGTEVKGHAFLTSASAEEAAQESDQIGASYFTHYLLSGLRGAADMSGDKRITLNEAYQFAYHETLARTERSRIGAQHPNYDLQLSGQGDVVLTDLRGSGAGLVLDKALGGRLFVRDAHGVLVAELAKPAGRVITLGFDPGAYTAVLHRDGQLLQARLVLAEGQDQALAMSDFTPMEGEYAVARGDAPEVYPTAPFAFGFVPGVSTNNLVRADGKVNNNVALSPLISDGHDLRGLELSGVLSMRSGEVHGVQIAGVGHLTDGPAHGVQAAGVFNYSKARHRGVQIAGVLNYSGDSSQGVQAGGVVNITQGDHRGVLIGGLTNLTFGEAKGVQVAGAYNYARDLNGLQISVVNVAGHAKGAQIGVINIADTMEGAPIGLFNFIGDGVFHVGAWGSDVAPTHIGVKMGSKTFYSIIAGAYRPASFGDKDEEIWMFGAGLGGRITLTERLALDLDAINYNLSDGDRPIGEETDGLVRARLMARWAAFDDLAVFGGPVFNVLYSKYRDGSDLDLFDLRAQRTADPDGEDVKVAWWPGFVVGVEAF